MKNRVGDEQLGGEQPTGRCRVVSLTDLDVVLFSEDEFVEHFVQSLRVQRL